MIGLLLGMLRLATYVAARSYREKSLALAPRLAHAGFFLASPQVGRILFSNAALPRRFGRSSRR